MGYRMDMAVQIIAGKRRRFSRITYTSTPTSNSTTPTPSRRTSTASTSTFVTTASFHTHSGTWSTSSTSSGSTFTTAQTHQYAPTFSSSMSSTSSSLTLRPQSARHVPIYMDLLISAPYKDRDDITPKVKARMVEIKARKPKTWEQRMLEKSRERYQQRVERMERGW